MKISKKPRFKSLISETQYDYDQNLIDESTMLDKIIRNFLMKYFSKNSEEFQFKTIEKINLILKKNRDKIIPDYNSEIYFSILISKLNELYINESKIKLETDLKNIDYNISQIKKNKSIKTKSKFLEIKHSQTKRLKEEGLSSREIKKYFLEFHNVDISHTYILNEFKKNASK